MMFNMNPMTLPVHCCCDPNKRLGWVKLERLPMPGQKLRFCIERASYSLMPSRGVVASADPNRTPDARFNPARYLEVEVAWLWLNTTDEILAVKSNDYPIEDWRKVVGFIEDNRRLVSDAPVR